MKGLCGGGGGAYCAIIVEDKEKPGRGNDTPGMAHADLVRGSNDNNIEVSRSHISMCGRFLVNVWRYHAVWLYKT